MKRSFAVVAALLALASPTHADRRRAVAPMDAGAVSLQFSDVAAGDGSLTAAGNDAWLEIGTISKRDARSRGIHVRREFALRVVRASGVSFGTARVTVRLQTWDGRETVLLDGRALTTAPLLIDPSVVIGATVVHRLDIEVPDSAPAGPINASVVWEVTSD